MIKVLYVLTVIALFILATIIKKKEDKIDFTTTFIVEVVVFICYNILSSFLLKLFNQNVTLLGLTIVNMVMSIPLIYKLIKDKKTQKYYIDLEDILAIVAISTFGIIVSCINYGLTFNISFICTDASNHYASALNFYNSGYVNTKDLCGAYINYGLFFKVFLNPNSMTNGINLFIGLEISKLIFSGILIYLAIKKSIKNKKKYLYIVAIVLSIIYMCAYPLNGMLSGFVYLQIAVNIVSAIIIIMSNYDSISNEIKNITLCILCFGLVFSYHFLSPAVLIAIAIYEMRNIKKEKIKTITNILKILLIPILVGIFCFFILPYIVNPATKYNPSTYVVTEVARNAYIYVSYFAMFIYFLPLCIYNIYLNVKNKKIDYLSILFILLVGYIVLTIIIQVLGRISRYYVMKTYYLLWFVMLTINGKVLLELLSSEIKNIYKTIINIFLYCYIIGIIISIFIIGPCSIKIFETEKESLTSMFNIYRLNYGVITHQTFEIIYTNDEIKFLADELSKIDKKDNTEILYLQDNINTWWVNTVLNEKKTPTINQQYKDIKEYVYNKEENEDKQIYIVCINSAFTRYNFNSFMSLMDNTYNKVSQKGRITIYTNK